MGSNSHFDLPCIQKLGQLRCAADLLYRPRGRSTVSTESGPSICQGPKQFLQSFVTQARAFSEISDVLFFLFVSYSNHAKRKKKYIQIISSLPNRTQTWWKKCERLVVSKLWFCTLILAYKFTFPCYHRSHVFAYKSL